MATDRIAPSAEEVALAARRSAFVDGLFFRVVACVFLEVVVLATALPSGVPLVRFLPAMGAAAAAGGVNALYWRLGKARGFPLSDFYGHWLVDLLTITLIIYALGGLDVPYGPFIYSMIVITSATFVSRSGAYVIATAAGACMIGMALAARFELLPAPMQVWSHHYSPAAEIGVLVGAIIFFFMNAYLAGTLSDQLKGAKAQIEDQNRLLEQRVRERTRELQDRTDELEELVHIVTHDLQNVAVASTENTRRLIQVDGEQLSERGTRYAERLLRDCRLMATMLRNLLEVVSKSEVADRRELVDVAAVVQDVVSRAQSSLEGKGIVVDVRHLEPVWAEEQKILHVFENLVSNACKYVGDKPSPRIEIASATENGTIEYSVQDNGIGIEETQLQRIFQLYHRAPEQVVGGVAQQGHGIGLAVVKRIVQRYGGRIWVESVQGEGTTFRLNFPRPERMDS